MFAAALNRRNVAADRARRRARSVSISTSTAPVAAREARARNTHARRTWQVARADAAASFTYVYSRARVSPVGSDFRPGRRQAARRGTHAVLPLLDSTPRAARSLRLGDDGSPKMARAGRRDGQGAGGRCWSVRSVRAHRLNLLRNCLPSGGRPQRVVMS